MNELVPAPKADTAKERPAIAVPRGLHTLHPRESAPLVKLIKMNMSKLRRFPIRKPPTIRNPKVRKRFIRRPA